VGILGHGGVGKTSLVETILYNSGATNRLGRVDEGTTVTDHDPDEISRKISINASVAYCEWNGYKINLIDTPGYADFIGEVKATIRVIDSALLVIQAVSGIEVGTEKVWKFLEESLIPPLIFINKMKKENTDFFKVVEMVKKILSPRAVLLQLPLGGQEKFRGTIDLVRMRISAPSSEEEIPADLLPQAENYREKLIETVAEVDDILLTKYLEGETLTTEEIFSGLKRGILERKFTPILCGDALENIGVKELLEAIINYLPSPAELPEIRGKKPNSEEEVVRKPTQAEPLSAFVFKTMTEPHASGLSFFRVYSGSLEAGKEVYNATKGRVEKIGQIFWPRGKERVEVSKIVGGDMGVAVKLKETTSGDTLCEKGHQILLPGIDFPKPVISVAIEPKTRGDEERVSNGLARLHEEDPTFVSYYDAETKQTLICGLGELHLDVIIARLKRKFGVEVNVLKPKIAYRETIRAPKVEVQGKYKRQTGGRGQYGDVWLRLEPLPRGKGFEFVDEIVGGVVPSGYIPAVEKGVKGAMMEGVIAGYPVTDIRVVLYDGSYHPVDSSNLAFEIAGSMALKKGVLEANPCLLEPIMLVEVVVPEEFVGEVMGYLNSKRWKIQGVDSGGGFQKIRALLPEAEMYKYSTHLRSMTQGRGSHLMEFSHYEEVPEEIAERLIAEAKKNREG